MASSEADGAQVAVQAQDAGVDEGEGQATAGPTHAALVTDKVHRAASL